MKPSRSLLSKRRSFWCRRARSPASTWIFCSASWALPLRQARGQAHQGLAGAIEAAPEVVTDDMLAHILLHRTVGDPAKSVRHAQAVAVARLQFDQAEAVSSTISTMHSGSDRL